MSTLASKEGFKAWWASLTPEKRKTLMGVGCLGLLLLVLYFFVSAGPQQPSGRGKEAKADTSLLTGSDARTLGLEALGAELKEAQRKQRELQGQLDRLAEQSPTKDDVKALGTQITTLTESVGTLRDGRDKTAPTDAPLVPSPASATHGGTSRSRTPFDDPSESVASPLNSAQRTLRSGPEAAEPIKVRVFGEAETPAAAGQAATVTDGIYIPAGSILSGVLLTGVDAPTGMQSKRDPIPALMRIKHDAILPNRFHSDVKECFVVFGATGDLSTERALMRAETLSCIRNDGGVIEVVVDAYALGDDGKAGVRGRLVSRNGSLVAKAAFASFAEALSQIFRPVAIQGINTSPGQRTEFQAPDASEALEAAGYAGFGGAMRRLSEYFVDLADEIVPFVEIDAARQVEAVLLKGVTLQIRSKKA